jgi:hypothetical protein
LRTEAAARTVGVVAILPIPCGDEASAAEIVVAGERRLAQKEATLSRLFTKADGSPDVGRILAGLIIGLVLIGVTVYLWATPGQAPNGDKMFDLAKVVIIGVLGIAVGESGK